MQNVDFFCNVFYVITIPQLYIIYFYSRPCVSLYHVFHSGSDIPHTSTWYYHLLFFEVDPVQEEFLELASVDTEPIIIKPPPILPELPWYQPPCELHPTQPTV